MFPESPYSSCWGFFLLLEQCCIVAFGGATALIKARSHQVLHHKPQNVGKSTFQDILAWASQTAWLGLGHGRDYPTCLVMVQYHCLAEQDHLCINMAPYWNHQADATVWSWSIPNPQSTGMLLVLCFRYSCRVVSCRTPNYLDPCRQIINKHM